MAGPPKLTREGWRKRAKSTPGATLTGRLLLAPCPEGLPGSGLCWMDGEGSCLLPSWCPWLGHSEAPLQPDGPRADAATFPALLHHDHRPSCISTTAPSAAVLQTHPHRYHGPSRLLPPGSCPWGGGDALGTPSPSLPSSVPRGAACAGRWAAGSCCDRWAAGPDHGTARNEGRVRPRGGGRLRELPANRPQHGSQHAVTKGGMGQGGDRVHGFRLFPARWSPRRIPEREGCSPCCSASPKDHLCLHLCGRE